jgi:aminoglycoside/choline kinase family phosphotransferase
MTLPDVRADARVDVLTAWLRDDLKLPIMRLEVASNDASFRRYFRVWCTDGESRVVMDAPPDKEDTAPFLKVAALLADCGVHVPRVYASDPQRGLVLLEDLGTVQYLTRLRAGDDPEPLYADALEALLAMQVRGLSACARLAPYDRAALAREMALMPEWFCERHLQLTLGDEDREVLADTFELLCEAALEQPQVFVHRDYHSRNLMLLAERNPGIVDFQDALAGPATYDLVSLLKDCYISWPRARVERWVDAYRVRLMAANARAHVSEQEFLRWFDLMGLQRHIKVLGIFARLWWRDGKSGYLGDLPRTLQYVREATALEPRLTHFGEWLERRVLPQFACANARALGLAEERARAAPAADAASPCRVS